MKKIFKSLVFIPFIGLTACSYVSKSYKEGPEAMKEETRTFIHFGTSPADG